jgi:para-aminobenzoate synthetase component 1
MIGVPPLTAWTLLLESALPFGPYGRYTFFATQPAATLVGHGLRATLAFADGTTRTGDTFELLDEVIAGAPRPEGADDLPWVGGAAGYLSYDLARVIEKLPEIARDDLHLPHIALGIYDAIAVKDRDSNTVMLYASGWPLEGRAAESEAERRLDRLQATLHAAAEDAQRLHPIPENRVPQETGVQLVPEMSRTSYLHAIARIQRYIADGDIYQANFAQRFRAPFRPDPRALFRRLRAAAPAPYTGVFVTPDVAVLSASPELFLQRRGHVVTTRPIKGTRPRGDDPAEDNALAAELLASPKDRAEHIMIVDVERNDLGRLAAYGQVATTELAELESFPGVHHLTSTIVARVPDSVTPSALIRATFPGGSVTGAPKIRAMEIIEELEPVRRGVYTGALGWFGFGGDCDLAMAIRTIVLAHDATYLWLGGGIVADSRADEEYEETLVKGRMLSRALGTDILGEGSHDARAAETDTLPASTHGTNRAVRAAQS